MVKMQVATTRSAKAAMCEEMKEKAEAVAMVVIKNTDNNIETFRRSLRRAPPLMMPIDNEAIVNFIARSERVLLSAVSNRMISPIKIKTIQVILPISLIIESAYALQHSEYADSRAPSLIFGSLVSIP